MWSRGPGTRPERQGPSEEHHPFFPGVGWPDPEASRDVTAIEYAIDNALFQWEDGERRLRERGDLERPALAVLEELRRRLGSSFSLEELTELYGANTDWASEVARSAGAGTEAARVVDAAFGRYAREAVDYRAGWRGPT